MPLASMQCMKRCRSISVAHCQRRKISRAGLPPLEGQLSRSAYLAGAFSGNAPDDDFTDVSG